MSNTKNCHYVSRFLTDPWQIDDHRYLQYYDFERDRFGRMSSRTLFAADGINSPTVETWLRDMVETPLASVRERLVQGDRAVLQTEWRLYRSAVLMLWLQGFRIDSVDATDARHELEEFASLPADHLDALVMKVQEDMDLRLVFTAAVAGGLYAPLFMPSAGIFQFVVCDEACVSGHSIGFGLPLSTRCALVVTPADRGGQTDLSLLSASLSNFSMGTAPAKRIVIHPGVIASMGQEKLRRSFKEQRALNDETLAGIHKTRALIREAFARVGIRPRVDRTGRLLKPV